MNERATRWGILGVLAAVLAAPARGGDDEPKAPKLTGIGIALKQTGEEGDEDRRPEVVQIVPEGPAAKDGRLQVGDVLEAVQKDGGEKVDLKGKPLSEVVDLFRGPKGTKIKLVVRPKGSKDAATKVYELTRAEISLPKPAQEAEPDDPK